MTAASPGAIGTGDTAEAGGPRRARRAGLFGLLGPAFVASIAYVDPGNVAANLTAGAEYGYLLVWVLVLANLMAVLVQYLSGGLGLVTGRSLPELVGERLPRPARLAYWVQAEGVAVATDVAEVVGGALALHILFGVDLFVGGVVTGVLSLLLLALRNTGGQRLFERVVVGFLVVITVGFVAGLFVAPVDWGQVLAGTVPRLQGTDSLLLAAGMLGATVMPHAIYLHSSLSRDRHGGGHDPVRTRRLLGVHRVDVGLALVVAGSVNIAMILLAAAGLKGVDGTDTIEGAHAAVGSAFGPVIATLFALGLLASGLASTSVGCYAGEAVMSGLLKLRIPILVRRAVTLVPALVVLGGGVDPTTALVLSQVVLSFGIPFALVPLLRFTNDRALMGEFANGVAVRRLGVVVVGIVVALNIALVWLTIVGR